jgi:glutamate-ammonia-ligase adenylyltransferase
LLKYGLENINRSYCIIALGKLGGNELNYSSDIDLIIFYDEDSPVNHKKEYQEILTEAIYLFIENATSITSSGFIYRVDFRLRPDGRTSYLCRSLTTYLNYYESRGEDWERQMLIKANFIAGDINLFRRFINYLQPFIYPSSFSISPTQQIKKLKANIEKGLKSQEDIKLQSGGIRDIEFAVQALQLLNGGKNKTIRTPNTLDAIKLLNKNNLLNSEETEELRSSYILYRRIEHFIQLMNDSQTHIIPSNIEILEKLRAFLYFDSTEKFKSEIAKRRRIVRKIYNSVMGEQPKIKIKSYDFSSINFESIKNAKADLQYLREGKGLLGQKEFDQKSIDAFQKLEPGLFNYLKASLKPDLVLKNFVRIIRNITFPSIWYNEFRDKKFFKLFLNLCEYSQKAIDIFAEDNDLREFFLTRKIFLKVNKENIKDFSVKKLLFILSVQFSDSLISYTEVSKILSAYFKQKIEFIAGNSIEKEVNSAYFIAGMGSFSAGEMTFSSDIDLVFVVKDIDAVPEIQKIFQNFLNILKDNFRPFDVDCRLRPEGVSSPLVWELNSYKNYIFKRARTWEFQAFCKLNFVCGNKKLFNNLIGTLNKKIETEEKENTKKEMKNMRKKLYPSDLSSLTKVFNIKKSPGGILDIDFIIQYLMLSNFNIFK